MDGGGVSGGKGGVTYCVWGGVCGTRPGVNSPTKHQRKVLIKHQVNSRKSTSSCSDWATCFILVHCTSHIVHPNTILLHRALCFFFFKNTFNLFSFFNLVQFNHQVFKRTLTETLRLPVRSTRAARELLFRQLTFVSKENIYCSGHTTTLFFFV